MQIVDRESAYAWLTDKPSNVILAIAARCALRSLPMIAYADSVTLHHAAHRTLRATLVSAVATMRTSPGVHSAAHSADTFPAADTVAAHNDFVRFAARSADAAALAVSLTASQSRTGTKLVIESALTGMLSAAHCASSSIWMEASLDADLADGVRLAEVWTSPLWLGDDSPPPNVSRALHELGLFWQEDRTIWGFWARWYDGMLNGTPLPWDLQEAVALIPDVSWEGGAEAIAEEIAKIEARFEVARSALDVEAFLTDSSERQKGQISFIGHNNPPPEEALPVSNVEMTELLSLVRTLQSQMQEQSATVEDIQASLSTIENTKTTIGAWLAEKLDISADEFFKEFGKWGGRLAVAGCGATAVWFFGLYEQLVSLFGALRNWIALMAG